MGLGSISGLGPQTKVMTGATQSASGKAGLVPSPASGDQGKYLKGDGTWASPTENNYSTTEKEKLAGIDAGANKYSLPTASANTLGGVKVGTNLSISEGVLSATDTTYNKATAFADGLMAKEDKDKLDKFGAAYTYALENEIADDSEYVLGLLNGQYISTSNGVIKQHQYGYRTNSFIPVPEGCTRFYLKNNLYVYDDSATIIFHGSNDITNIISYIATEVPAYELIQIPEGTKYISYSTFGNYGPSYITTTVFITNKFIDKSEVVNRLDSTDEIKPLSANMGRVLNNSISELDEKIDEKIIDIENTIRTEYERSLNLQKGYYYTWSGTKISNQYGFSNNGFFPISVGFETFYLKENSLSGGGTNQATILFLSDQSYSSIVGYETKNITKEETIVKIPEGAKYMVFSTYNRYTTFTSLPVKIVFFKNHLIPSNDIVDALNSTDSEKPLSANMGKTLNDTKLAKPAVQGTEGQVLSLDSDLNPIWSDVSSGGETEPYTTSITLLSTGWSNNKQTVNLAAISATNKIVVSPAPTSLSDYAKFGCYASEQANGSITFTCTAVPTSNLTVNIAVMVGDDLTTYLKSADVVNAVASNNPTNKPLSAYQGYLLNENKVDKNASVLTAGTDLNTLFESGNYFVSTGEHTPESEGWLFIKVTKLGEGDDNTCIHEARKYTSNKMWIRGYSNSDRTWTAWERIDNRTEAVGVTTTSEIVSGTVFGRRSGNIVTIIFGAIARPNSTVGWHKIASITNSINFPYYTYYSFVSGSSVYPNAGAQLRISSAGEISYYGNPNVNMELYGQIVYMVE